MRSSHRRRGLTSSENTYNLLSVLNFKGKSKLYVPICVLEQDNTRSQCLLLYNKRYQIQICSKGKRGLFLLTLKKDSCSSKREIAFFKRKRGESPRPSQEFCNRDPVPFMGYQSTQLLSPRRHLAALSHHPLVLVDTTGLGDTVRAKCLDNEGNTLSRPPTQLEAEIQLIRWNPQQQRIGPAKRLSRRI